MSMIIDSPKYPCSIWGGHGTLPNPERNSERAGGRYIITRDVADTVPDLDEKHKVRLTTMLIDQRRQGVELPEVTPQLVEDSKNKPSLPVYERAERLLQYFSSKTGKVGDSLRIDYDIDDLIFQGALAWSESTVEGEVDFLIKYLKKKGWIDGNRGAIPIGTQGASPTVTVEGYGHIADLRTNQDSRQCFVAMWFDNTMNDLYDQGIKPAIEATGYTPMRIDKKPHANKIDDEIIAEIRRSRFLVADFTHGKDGARGGVYYEAGFAHGLDLPVIFLCRNDMIDKLHFDTRQYNHIVWENNELDELCKNLTNRIEAVIGEGPNKGETI